MTHMRITSLLDYVERVREETRVREQLQERFNRIYGWPPLGPDAEKLIVEFMVSRWRKTGNLDNAIADGIDRAFKLIDEEMQAIGNGLIKLEGGGSPTASRPAALPHITRFKAPLSYSQ